jgi:hypothetical protein
MTTGWLRLGRSLRQSWDTAGLVVVTAVLLGSSIALSNTAAWIPRAVLGITLGCIALQFALDIRRGARVASAAMPDRPSAAPGRGVAPARALAWIAGLLLAVLLLGKPLGAALFTAAYLRGHAGETWLTSAVFAVVLGGCIHLVFGTPG